ncbi:hypothetical protein [Streptomyces olivochromogenes]|uniref:Uncharacterized protein n=1 Tax=Streptomyces olivochromogenes TaxID=1963 RepID=A0A250VPZ5_STROL|nr:hypothetical protein [Streptomyces olivochromogenes]GAX56267.1 hypothetical protein SO3561_07834 [Streptomyces olivochromogenes]
MRAATTNCGWCSAYVAMIPVNVAASATDRGDNHGFDLPGTALRRA